MGIVLFVVRKWSDCAILVTAILFLLQPVEWYHYIVGLFDPSHTLPDWGVGAMYKEVAEYTKAVVDKRPCFHISLVVDVSPQCDCHSGK